MHGAAFLGSFLLETPFALMRGIAGLFIPVVIGMFFVCSYKENRLYEERK
nr:hypothetical protein [Bacillus cereus]